MMRIRTTLMKGSRVSEEERVCRSFWECHHMKHNRLTSEHNDQLPFVPVGKQQQHVNIILSPSLPSSLPLPPPSLPPHRTHAG